MDELKSFLARRFRGDSGSVVVESAMILPVVLAFLAGTVDMGVAFRDRIQIENALRAAARVGASGQNTGNTDQLALSSLAASMVGIKNAKITKVVIFETDSTGAMSNTCTVTAPAAGGAGDSLTANKNCNIYSDTQVSTAASATNFTAATDTSCGSHIDHYWCPLNRVIDLTSTAGSGGTGPDYLGISMTVDYTPFTRFWGSKFTITDQVVVRLEPSAG